MLEKLSAKNISKNVVATVLQVIISGLVFFVLYRFLYDKLGVEQIGIWSLVLAATSISRIGELGLSAGVVRFVAQALGRGDNQRAADVVQTVTLTLGVFMVVLLAICYPLFILALNYLIPEKGIAVALTILPYALVSLWVMIVVSVLSGGLDGCMRMDVRSLLMGLSHLAYLGFSILLVPQYGLEGVAAAQLIQSVGLMVFMWWALKRQMKELPILPRHWKLPVLKEMIGYGVNFQIITVMNMLFDPLVKAMMSRFGGLEALGFYEMANKLILQGRAIIVEASRVMVPAVATLQEHDQTKAAQLFATTYRLTFYISVLFYGLLGISITSISVLWLGHYQETFILYSLLLTLGWFMNTLIGPAYFSNLGSGKLKQNMISHAIMGVCSLIFGVVLGKYYGGNGVVAGTVISLIAGSMYLLVTYIKQAGINLSEFIIPQNMISLFMLSMLTIILANYGRDQYSANISVIAMALLCGVILLSLGWLNPARKMLSGVLKLNNRKDI